MGDARRIAQVLLEAQAVSLRPSQPFTYASGLKSPIYCDNRVLLGLPDAREQVISAFLEKLASIGHDALAGTATAGIAWCAWLARERGVPMAYVRSKPKGYGQGRLIEGALPTGARIVVIEDLVSTGGSAIAAIEAVRAEQPLCEAVACLAIFTYGLRAADEGFERARCPLQALTDLRTLLDVAQEGGIITADELEEVERWQRDPETWSDARSQERGA